MWRRASGLPPACTRRSVSGARQPTGRASSRARRFDTGPISTIDSHVRGMSARMRSSTSVDDVGAGEGRGNGHDDRARFVDVEGAQASLSGSERVHDAARGMRSYPDRIARASLPVPRLMLPRHSLASPSVVGSGKRTWYSMASAAAMGCVRRRSPSGKASARACSRGCIRLVERGAEDERARVVIEVRPASVVQDRARSGSTCPRAGPGRGRCPDSRAVGRSGESGDRSRAAPRSCRPS